jgi:hypothetical protein
VHPDDAEWTDAERVIFDDAEWSDAERFILEDAEWTDAERTIFDDAHRTDAERIIFSAHTRALHCEPMPGCTALPAPHVRSPAARLCWYARQAIRASLIDARACALPTDDFADAGTTIPASASKQPPAILASRSPLSPISVFNSL